MNSSPLLEAINGMPDVFHVETDRGSVMLNTIATKQTFNAVILSGAPFGEKLNTDETVGVLIVAVLPIVVCDILFHVSLIAEQPTDDTVLLKLLPHGLINSIDEKGRRGFELSPRDLPFTHPVFVRVKPVPFTMETK